MTYGLLVKKDSEIKSCEAVASFMSNKAVVRRTGEDWPDDLEMVIRWGCTANVPKGVKIINPAHNIHCVNNKSQFRAIIREEWPNHIPLTWLSTDKVVSVLDMVNHFPLVVRPKQHSRGEHFHVCTTTEQLKQALEICGEDSYISKFINKQKELRIFFVQNRVICVVEKCPNNTNLNTWGLAANWNNYKWSEWPVEAVRKALRLHMASGLHFSAADVLQDVDGSYVVCELNSAPELGGNYYAQKFAGAFDWMIANHREAIPVDMEQTDWKYYAHPSLSDKVVV